MKPHLPALNQVVVQYPAVDTTGHEPRYRTGAEQTFTAGPGSRIDAWLREHNGTRRLAVTFQHVGADLPFHERVPLDILVEDAVLAGFGPDEVLWTGFAVDRRDPAAGHRYVRLGFRHADPEPSDRALLPLTDEEWANVKGADDQRAAIDRLLRARHLATKGVQP